MWIFDIPLTVVADLCEWATVFISLVGYLPQWRELLRTRSSKNISVKAWITWLGASVLATFYAAVQTYEYGTGHVLLYTSLINLTFLMVTIGLVIRFKNPHIGKADYSAILEEMVSASESSHEEIRDTLDQVILKLAAKNVARSNCQELSIN